MEISNEAAQKIVYAINFHLEEQGLTNIRSARILAIQLAADVKRIMIKELGSRTEAVVHNHRYPSSSWTEFD